MGRHVERRHVPLFRGSLRDYAPADGLPGVRVPVIAQAVDNGLWIGTNGGLVRLRKPRFTVYTERDGLASDFIGSIVQDRAGSVWVETRRGLTRFVNGAFRPLTTDDGLPAGRTRKLATGADGQLRVYTQTAWPVGPTTASSESRTSPESVGPRERPPRGSVGHALGRYP